MKLHTKTPHELRMLILGSKAEGHNALINENGLSLTYNSFPFSPIIMKLHTHHDVEDVPYRFWGLNVKGQDNALVTEKWLLVHNCFPFAPIIHRLLVS